jgi:protein ImuB
MKPVYACVYAREFPAQALSRLRPEVRAQACAVMEGEAPHERVCSANAKARRLGVEHGMTRVEIDTVPGVTVLARSVAEEASARAALLECAGRFSPRVEELAQESCFVCVVDIAGTETLFGRPERLAKKLLAEVETLGVAACVAVSGNFHAALSLAQGMQGARRVLAVAEGQVGAALAPLPLGVLCLSPAQTETFMQWGIGTLGQLAALPETALISRLGQPGKRARLLARGELPHLFLPIEPQFALLERLEFESPVEVLDSLLFVVSTMLEQLALRANARALALATVSVTLALEGGAGYVRTVRPALPSNDRQLWIKLIHLDMEAHPPDAAILALELTATPGATSTVQMGLFSPQTPEAARLDVTLARIRAIVGEDAVGQAVLVDTHRTDAFRMEAFHIATSAPAGRPSLAAPHGTKQVASRAATRQLRPAENITVTLRDGRPETFFFRGMQYVVERAYGPWLASGTWWSLARWKLEQWDIVARAGETRLCCMIAREATLSRWMLAAFYD